MKKNNSNGFGLLGVILIIVCLSLIGFIAWYVLGSGKSKEPDASNTVKMADSSDQIIPMLSLKEDRLPEGWTVDVNEPQRILISNNSTKCFVDALYLESRDLISNQKQQTVDSVKSKGYTVEETTGKITIVTANQEKQIDSQVLKIEGLDNPMYQAYGYINKEDTSLQIQLSCAKESDIGSAQDALKTIIFNKE